MKQNYIETILGAITFLIAMFFLIKFLEVNTEKNSTNSYMLKAKFIKVGGIMIMILNMIISGRMKVLKTLLKMAISTILIGKKKEYLDIIFH